MQIKTFKCINNAFLVDFNAIIWYCQLFFVWQLILISSAQKKNQKQTFQTVIHINTSIKITSQHHKNSNTKTNK